LFFGRPSKWLLFTVKAPSGLHCPCGEHSVFSLCLSRNLAPLVRASVSRPHGITRPIGQSIFARTAKFSIACSTSLGDFDKAKRDGHVDRRANSVVMNAVLFKIRKFARKVAVLGASMVRVFNFETGKHEMRRQGQCAIRWAFKHLN
jgi:hypothetical protein